ncbi:hypothetical protein EDM80_08955 [bacterium]|nr:MAG: hypothetical protein EDM80_08955 [bacterium]RIK61521.1 MAG: hypothetical protein DCC64_13045 [Planctomycetota bacterium]
MGHLEYAGRVFGAPPPPGRPRPALLALPAPGQCLAVTGPSGAGKTLALDALARVTGAAPARALTRQALSRTVLDLFEPGLPSPAVLRTLAATGLADYTLWARAARTLSMGERRRLELALALVRGPSAVILDEFDAHLDLATAQALACTLRRLARQRSISLVASTHREELLPYLAPASVVEIRGPEALARPQTALALPRDLLEEFTFERGRLADYGPWARWHYASARRPGPVTDVFLARLRDEVAGVALLGMTHLFLGPRNIVLPDYASSVVASGSAARLNRDLRLLQRVVIHPRWRGLGLATRLVRHALENVPVPFVECLAEMGGFSGFLVRAGFEHRGRCEPSREARRLMQSLERLGLCAEDLLRPERLKALALAERERLQRQVNGLCRSRIETGHGALRGGASVLDFERRRQALMRLHCRPEYFLYTRKP